MFGAQYLENGWRYRLGYNAGTCTGQTAVWGFVSLGSTHCDRVIFFFRGSLVTWWEAPGGFAASSGLWLANYFPSVL